jgi:hypothetical protein
MAVAVSEPDAQHAAPAPKSKSMGKGSAFVLPGLFVMAWVFALSGSTAPGAIAGEATAMGYLRWVLYFAGFVFLFSAVMHSVFRNKMAASIGWTTNGFEIELASVSLGLSAACFYATYNGIEAMIAVSLPIISFLFLAGVNHVVEIVRKQNYAPNNTFILIWDFGVPISLVALLVSVHAF